MNTIKVNAENGEYPVFTGAGLLGKFAADISEVARSSTAFIVIDEGLPQEFKARLKEACKAARGNFRFMEISVSEKHKALATYEKICLWLLEEGAERTSPLAAVGGGVTGDMAGFAAATYQRGIPFFQVPTTLLSMVDASVGGKVAVNLGGAKNMLGCFYQPRAVYADVEVLHSLDKRQMSCGLAECFKHGMIGDRALFNWTADHLGSFLSYDAKALTELVARNVAFKANIVAQDAKEFGIRALLNLGHTFGHAIEKCDFEKKYFHGEAVSIGIVAAVHLAVSKNLAHPDLLEKVHNTVQRAGLPVSLDLPVSPERLLAAMKQDKKSAYKKLKLIVPREIGVCEIRDDAADKEILAALKKIMA